MDICHSLLDNFEEYNFKSCHNLITRPESESCIYCVFSNVPDNRFVNVIQNAISDHNFIFCRIKTKFLNSSILVEKHDYEKYGTYLMKI